MKKIIFICGCKDNSQRYRVFNQAEQLELKGYYTLKYYFTHYTIYDQLSDVYCIIMHRVPYLESIEQIIKKAEKLGVKVYYDIDDMVFDMEYAKQSDGINNLNENDKKIYFEGVQRYKKIIQICHGIIVSTQFLYDTIKKYNSNVLINRNALGSKLIELSKKENENYIKHDNIIRIGYFSGTNTHNKDFLEVSDVLYEILVKYKHVHLIIGGLLDLPEKFKYLSEQIKKKPLVEWEKLPNIIKQVDINLAPLEINNPFCRAKSEIKYIEAAILKVPTVASNIDSYKFAINHGKTGFLVNNKKEWYIYIQKLILDEKLRKKIANKAYEVVLENYSSVARSENLIYCLNKLQKNA